MSKNMTFEITLELNDNIADNATEESIKQYIKTALVNNDDVRTQIISLSVANRSGTGQQHQPFQLAFGYYSSNPGICFGSSGAACVTTGM